VEEVAAAMSLVGRLVQVYARPPPVMSHGVGCRLWDTDNRSYLDFCAGIAVTALGHSDAGVTAAITEQAGKLLHTSNLFHNDQAIALSEELIEACQRPGHSETQLSRVFLANSGTEAIEAALKLTRKYAKDQGQATKTGITVFSHGFHGRTIGAVSATDNAAYRAPFEPLLPGVERATFNGSLEELDQRIHRTTCAVVVEPIQGEGGILEADAQWLQHIRKRCTETGALLVFDEIQCGLSRTGRVWGHHHYTGDVCPDVMTIAKPLANGIPIGAMVATEKAASAFTVGAHGTTFGGNPFAAHVARHVLARLTKPEFLEHVNSVGGYLKTQLTQLATVHSSTVVDVRGRGLLLGMELADKDSVGRLVDNARERGLLVVGAARNTVRVIPPLVVNRSEVDEAIGILDQSLKDIPKQAS